MNINKFLEVFYEYFQAVSTGIVLGTMFLYLTILIFGGEFTIHFKINWNTLGDLIKTIKRIW
jgi:hypothetical protein